jgi:hypothetical protein
MESNTFDVEKVLGGASVRCREPYFTATIERPASKHSRYAFTGRVTCAAGGMAMCWLPDGSAVRQSSALFQEHPDSDFDLTMVVKEKSFI